MAKRNGVKALRERYYRIKSESPTSKDLREAFQSTQPKPETKAYGTTPCDIYGRTISPTPTPSEGRPLMSGRPAPLPPSSNGTPVMQDLLFDIVAAVGIAGFVSFLLYNLVCIIKH